MPKLNKISPQQLRLVLDIINREYGGAWQDKSSDFESERLKRKLRTKKNKALGKHTAQIAVSFSISTLDTLFHDLTQGKKIPEQNGIGINHGKAAIVLAIKAMHPALDPNRRAQALRELGLFFRDTLNDHYRAILLLKYAYENAQPAAHLHQDNAFLQEIIDTFRRLCDESCSDSNEQKAQAKQWLKDKASIDLSNALHPLTKYYVELLKSADSENQKQLYLQELLQEATKHAGIPTQGKTQSEIAELCIQYYKSKYIPVSPGARGKKDNDEYNPEISLLWFRALVDPTDIAFIFQLAARYVDQRPTNETHLRKNADIALKLLELVEASDKPEHEALAAKAKESIARILLDTPGKESLAIPRLIELALNHKNVYALQELAFNYHQPLAPNGIPEASDMKDGTKDSWRKFHDDIFQSVEPRKKERALSTVLANPAARQALLNIAIAYLNGNTSSTTANDRSFPEGFLKARIILEGLVAGEERFPNAPPLDAAHYHLGFIYLIGGHGVHYDPVKALVHFERCILAQAADRKLQSQATLTLNCLFSPPPFNISQFVFDKRTHKATPPTKAAIAALFADRPRKVYLALALIYNQVVATHNGSLINNLTTTYQLVEQILADIAADRLSEEQKTLLIQALQTLEALIPSPFHLQLAIKMNAKKTSTPVNDRDVIAPLLRGLSEDNLTLNSSAIIKFRELFETLKHLSRASQDFRGQFSPKDLADAAEQYQALSSANAADVTTAKIKIAEFKLKRDGYKQYLAHHQQGHPALDGLKTPVTEVFLLKREIIRKDRIEELMLNNLEIQTIRALLGRLSLNDLNVLRMQLGIIKRAEAKRLSELSDPEIRAIWQKLYYGDFLIQLEHALRNMTHHIRTHVKRDMLAHKLILAELHKNLSNQAFQQLLPQLAVDTLQDLVEQLDEDVNGAFLGHHQYLAEIKRKGWANNINHSDAFKMLNRQQQETLELLQGLILQLSEHKRVDERDDDGHEESEKMAHPTAPMIIPARPSKKNMPSDKVLNQMDLILRFRQLLIYLVRDHQKQHVEFLEREHKKEMIRNHEIFRHEYTTQWGEVSPELFPESQPLARPAAAGAPAIPHEDSSATIPEFRRTDGSTSDDDSAEQDTVIFVPKLSVTTHVGTHDDVLISMPTARSKPPVLPTLANKSSVGAPDDLASSDGNINAGEEEVQSLLAPPGPARRPSETERLSGSGSTNRNRGEKQPLLVDSKEHPLRVFDPRDQQLIHINKVIEWYRAEGVIYKKTAAQLILKLHYYRTPTADIFNQEPPKPHVYYFIQYPFHNGDYHGIAIYAPEDYKASNNLYSILVNPTRTERFLVIQATRVIAGLVSFAAAIGLGVVGYNYTRSPSGDADLRLYQNGDCTTDSHSLVQIFGNIWAGNFSGNAECSSQNLRHTTLGIADGVLYIFIFAGFIALMALAMLAETIAYRVTRRPIIHAGLASHEDGISVWDQLGKKHILVDLSQKKEEDHSKFYPSFFKPKLTSEALRELADINDGITPPFPSLKDPSYSRPRLSTGSITPVDSVPNLDVASSDDEKESSKRKPLARSEATAHRKTRDEEPRRRRNAERNADDPVHSESPRARQPLNAKDYTKIVRKPDEPLKLQADDVTDVRQLQAGGGFQHRGKEMLMENMSMAIAERSLAANNEEQAPVLLEGARAVADALKGLVGMFFSEKKEPLPILAEDRERVAQSIRVLEEEPVAPIQGNIKWEFKRPS